MRDEKMACLPLRKAGESCHHGEECAPGVCIAAKCAPRPKVGEACDPHSMVEQCIDGFCGAAMKCVPLANVGEPCFVNENCAGEHPYCKDSRCAKRPRLGEACGPGECIDSYCGPEKRCVPAAKAGEICTLDELHCSEDLKCIVTDDAGPARCHAPVGPGAACIAGTQWSHHADNCTAGFFCDSPGKGVCTRLRAPGAPCTATWQCQDECRSSHCSDPRSGGGGGFSRPHGF